MGAGSVGVSSGGDFGEWLMDAAYSSSERVLRWEDAPQKLEKATMRIGSDRQLFLVICDGFLLREESAYIKHDDIIIAKIASTTKPSIHLGLMALGLTPSMQCRFSCVNHVCNKC